MKKEVTKKPKQRKEEMEKSKKPRRIKALKKRSNPGPRKLGSPPIDWNPIIIETIKGVTFPQSLLRPSLSHTAYTSLS